MTQIRAGEGWQDDTTLRAMVDVLIAQNEQLLIALKGHDEWHLNNDDSGTYVGSSLHVATRAAIDFCTGMPR